MQVKLLYQVEEAAELINLGRSTVFELIRSGQLESVKVGRKRLIAAADLDAFVVRLRAVQNLATGREEVQA